MPEKYLTLIVKQRNYPYSGNAIEGVSKIATSTVRSVFLTQ